MVKEGFYVGVVVLIVAVIAAIVGQVAPVLERVGQSAINIQAAPTMAAITVQAAQYAFDAQKTRDAQDAAQKARDLENSRIIADGKAARERAEGEATRINAENGWIPYALIAMSAVLVISTMSGVVVYRTRAMHEVAMAPHRAEESVSRAVVLHGGSASYKPSGERSYDVRPPVTLPRALPRVGAGRELGGAEDWDRDEVAHPTFRAGGSDE